MADRPRDFMQRFRFGIWAVAGIVLAVVLAISFS